jgi:hypothetical protein
LNLNKLKNYWRKRMTEEELQDALLASEAKAAAWEQKASTLLIAIQTKLTDEVVSGLWADYTAEHGTYPDSFVQLQQAAAASLPEASEQEPIRQVVKHILEMIPDENTLNMSKVADVSVALSNLSPIAKMWAQF